MAKAQKAQDTIVAPTVAEILEALGEHAEATEGTARGGKVHPIPAGTVRATVTHEGEALVATVAQNLAGRPLPAVAQAVAAVALRKAALPWAAVGDALGHGAGWARSAVADGLRAQAPAKAPGARGTSAAQAALPLARRDSAGETTQGQGQ